MTSFMASGQTKTLPKTNCTRLDKAEVFTGLLLAVFFNTYFQSLVNI